MLMDFPEPRRRRKEIVEDLCSGKTVIWIFPYQVNLKVCWQRVADECDNVGFDSKIIRIDPDNFKSPINLIAQQCGIPFESNHQTDINYLIRNEDLPQILIIDGINGLAQEQFDIWKRFIDEWTQMTRMESESTSFLKTLFVPMHYLEQVNTIHEDVYLRVHYYWAWYGSNEINMIAHHYAYELGFEPDVLGWAESVIVEIAGSDLDLMEYLFCGLEGKDKSVAMVIESLSQYGKEEKAWTIQTLADIDNITKGKMSSFRWEERIAKPSPRLGRLWAEGIIASSNKDEIAVNSAALALKGYLDPIYHRIWRGQSRVLLPMLDMERMDLCQYLNVRFPQWSSQIDINNGGLLCSIKNQGDPVGEYGDILTFLVNKQNRTQKHQELIACVDFLRRCRNNMAHYSPIDFGEFVSLRKKLYKTSKMIS